MTKLTRLDVRAKVGKIAEEMHDDESAHGMEDGLWELVLKTVATGNTDDPQGICNEALKTKRLDFSRWCA